MQPKPVQQDMPAVSRQFAAQSSTAAWQVLLLLDLWPAALVGCASSIIITGHSWSYSGLGEAAERWLGLRQSTQDGLRFVTKTQTQMS